ncbi:hypothetical protein BU24DRAFT_68101 [Aaosphaeria arxii CBS 175.79]|uniref:Uncharacterized protein n=1 Tax=Aaosphaeria arxii CBS 175.79 TaxID=1450172 RepID=A0A6A5XAL3_9PLEO|nr:uncharacterized protein BU24DRAFT_68101 [Aaosphaeria arxii CBS 175.79]KAF2009949.1 hypothetical protein BU24DRAFT_68101 [Aaosphaeria arxii CBS 175.79]
MHPKTLTSPQPNTPNPLPYISHKKPDPINAENPPLKNPQHRNPPPSAPHSTTIHHLLRRTHAHTHAHTHAAPHNQYHARTYSRPPAVSHSTYTQSHTYIHMHNTVPVQSDGEAPIRPRTRHDMICMHVCTCMGEI